MAASNLPEHPDNEFLKRAYALKNPTEARELYDEWAAQYDKDLEAEEYFSPQHASEVLVKLLRESRSGSDGSERLEGLRILDAGCGTGMVGRCLVRLGTTPSVDGLDISPGMLEVARKASVYAALDEADLSQPIAKDDSSYDALICTGTLTRAHVGPGVLDEFVRVVKSQGYIVATVLDEVWESMGFKAKVDGLQDNGKAKLLQSDTFGVYKKAESHGRLLVLRKE